MAIRDTSIRLRLDDSEAQSRVKKLQAQLNGIDRKKYKVNLDIDDKKLKRTVASLNQLKNVKFGSNADALTSQFSRLETVSKRFQEQLSRGAKGSVLLGTSNQIDNITSKIQKLNQQQVGDLFKNAGSSVASLRSGVDSLATSIGNVLQKAALIGGAFAGVALAGITKLGKGALDTFSTIEDSKVGLTTLLGAEDAQKTLNRIRVEAARTPFELGDLSNLTLQLAAVTKNGDKALNTVLDFGKAVTASGKSTAELNNVAANFVQVASTGKVTELDIRQFQRAIPVFNDVIAESGLTTEALKESENAADLLFKAFEKSGKSGIIAKAFVNASGSLTQLKSNLKDILFGGGAQVLEDSGFIGVVKKGLTSLIDFIGANKDKLSNFLKPFVAQLDKIDFTKVFNSIAGFASKAVPTIINEFKRIKTEITPVVKAVSTVVGNFLSKLGGGDKVKGAIVLIEKLVKAFIALKIASPILGGLSKSLGLIGTIMQGGNLSGLLGLVQGFAKAGTSGFAGLASGFAGMAGALGSALPVILAVAAAVGVLFLAIRKISQSELLKSIFAALIKPLVNAFKMLWESLKQAYQAIKPIIDIFGKAIAWQGIVTLVVVVGSLAASLTALAIVLKVIVDLFRLQVAVVKAAGQSIGAFLMLLKTGNVNQFMSSMKGINSEFKNTVTGIGNSYKQFFSGFKTDANSAKTSADALKTAIDGIKGAIDTLSGASLNVENLKIQFAEAVKASQDALAAAGGDTSNSAYRQAKINEFQVQQQLNEAIQQEKDLKSQLSAQYDDLISKSSQGVAISQQEKDAILEKLKLYKTQQEALGLNTAELDKMITNIEKINATPANAQTTTNAPETQEKQEGVLIKQDEINNKPAEARVTANDQASGPLDNILGKLQQIVSRVWNTTVNVAASGIDGIRNRIEGLINRANRATGTLIQASGGIVPQYRQAGGLIYAAKGYVHPGNPRGSDIVPAWLSPGEGVVRRSSMASLGKNMFNEINRRGGDAIRDVFNKGFQAGNTYNNKTANTTVNITNNNPGSAMSSIMGLDRRINNGIA